MSSFDVKHTVELSDSVLRGEVVVRNILNAWVINLLKLGHIRIESDRVINLVMAADFMIIVMINF